MANDRKFTQEDNPLELNEEILKKEREILENIFHQIRSEVITFNNSSSWLKNTEKKYCESYVNENYEEMIPLFKKLEYNQEACSNLLDFFYVWSQYENLLTQDNFIKLFTTPKQHLPSTIAFFKKITEHSLSDLFNQANFDSIIKNAPYSKYIVHVIENNIEGLQDQDAFDRSIDNVNFSDPEFFLQYKGSFLLAEDFKNPPQEFSIENSIAEHTARVFNYLQARDKGNDSDSETDEEEEKMNPLKGIHGITHLASVAFYIPVMANFLARHGDEKAAKLTSEQIKLLQIAALFHDLGREAEGEDFWDHDSGLMLYYYLTSVCKESSEQAKVLAEAITNKDAETLGFYRQLVEYESGKFRWEKTTDIPALNIERKVLHDVDCLEVRRARNVFDVTYLHAWEMVKNNEAASQELIQLTTEVHGGIVARGEAYKHQNLNVKKEYYNSDAYTAISNIFESKEKKQDILISSFPYCIIPALYDINGFNPTMSIPKLPTAQLLPSPSDWKLRMDKGELYARAITLPTKRVPSTKSKRTNKEKSPETYGEFESRKTSRQKGTSTRSGAIDKRGFELRSTSMLGPATATYGEVGFIIYTQDLTDIVQFHTSNIKSGYGKKLAFKKMLETKEDKESDESKHEKHQHLMQYVKTGHDPVSGKTSHNEVIMRMTQPDAIFFTRDPIRKERSLHPYSRMLQAIYLQKMYAANGITLPILEYSNQPSNIQVRTFSEEQIKQMWIKLCSDYINSEKKKGKDISKMPIDELLVRSMYIFQQSHNDFDRFEAADKYYEESLKAEIRKTVHSIQITLTTSSRPLPPTPGPARQPPSVVRELPPIPVRPPLSPPPPPRSLPISSSSLPASPGALSTSRPSLPASPRPTLPRKGDSITNGFSVFSHDDPNKKAKSESLIQTSRTPHNNRNASD